MTKSLARLMCLLFDHNYRVVRRMNSRTRKVGCDRCGRCWAMHDPTRSFVEWSPEFEELYGPDEILGKP
jgi:hypothetical protein